MKLTPYFLGKNGLCKRFTKFQLLCMIGHIKAFSDVVQTVQTAIFFRILYKRLHINAFHKN